MPIARERPVKSLGRLYTETPSDRSQGVAIMQQAEHGLKATDQTKLPGKYKIRARNSDAFSADDLLARVRYTELSTESSAGSWFDLSFVSSAK